MTKLDMGKAWSGATEMIATNRDVMLIIVGVFVFLPNLALMLFMGDSVEALQAQAAGDPEQAIAAMTEFYSGMALPMIIISLFQAVGVMALLSLLNDSRRPTVGEAIKIGLVCLLPYIAAQLIQALIWGLLILVPVTIGAATGSVGIGVLIGMVAVAAAVYIWVKFSLTAPVLAIEGVRNPIAALKRSWGLTKGNSLLIFAFFLLLIGAFMIISVIISMVFGVFFALMGGEVALIGNGIVGAAVNALMALVMVAALAAIHQQLTGGSPEAVIEAFE